MITTGAVGLQSDAIYIARLLQPIDNLSNILYEVEPSSHFVFSSPTRSDGSPITAGDSSLQSVIDKMSKLIPLAHVERISIEDLSKYKIRQIVKIDDAFKEESTSSLSDESSDSSSVEPRVVARVETPLMKFNHHTTSEVLIVIFCYLIASALPFWIATLF